MLNWTGVKNPAMPTKIIFLFRHTLMCSFFISVRIVSSACLEISAVSKNLARRKTKRPGLICHLHFWCCSLSVCRGLDDFSEIWFSLWSIISLLCLHLCSLLCSPTASPGTAWVPAAPEWCFHSAYRGTHAVSRLAPVRHLQQCPGGRVNIRKHLKSSFICYSWW